MAKKIFGDDAVPKELVIPKQDPRCNADNKDTGSKDNNDKKEPDNGKNKKKRKKNGEKKKEESAEERDDYDEEEEDMKTDETTAVTTTTTMSSSSPSTTSSKKEDTASTTASSAGGDKTPAESGIPPEKRCRGTCVTGFFSLLCDEIDRAALCPGNGRCCITRSGPPPPPSANQNPSRPANQPRPTRPPPPPPSPAGNKNNNNRVVQCPGVCIPNVMLGLCAQPSKIVPGTNSCAEGSFCCDHGGQGLDRKDVPPPQPPPQQQRPPPPPRPQPQRPAGPDLTQLLLSVAPTLIGAASGSQSTADTVSSLMPLLAPMLTNMLTGGGGGSSRPSAPQRVGTVPPPQRPAPPTRPTAPPTTTPVTTTTTETPDDRDDCPGTCIAPYLSFTCFGNAETTDLFRCAKKKTTCCSPKSAVRTLREQLQRASFPPAESIGSGAPGSPQFLLPPVRRNQTVGPPNRRPQKPPPPAAAGGAAFYEPEDTFNDANYYDVGGEDGAPSASSYPFPVSAGNGGVAAPERPPLQYPVTNKYVCGVKGTYRSGRVIGGEDGVPGEWCWQVALINSLNQYLCGGALIGTQWVLTAAHCVTK